MNCLPGINTVYTGLVRRGRFSAASAVLQRRGAQWTRQPAGASSQGNQVTRLSDRAVVLLTVGAFAAVVVGIAVIGAVLAG